jgi:hypothetical protein
MTPVAEKSDVAGTGVRRWTVDEVLKLAPDGSSAGAARRLSLTAVWSQAGSSGSLLWGKCQGSAREPYQVTVDLHEPSFRCTCPSRKQPCKHGLALLLLWAGGDGSVADDARPAGFAAEWVQRLAARGAAAGSGSAGGAGRPSAAAPVDPEAQARRLAQRIETMSAGVDEFERWLFDLVRQGLAPARHQPFSFWDAAASRLVDAQMPGLADRVRALPGLLHSSGDWADRLLAELARGYLAVSAWRRRDVLSDDALADLRVVLGWPRRVDEVLERGERVVDRWVVMGLAQETDARLQSQRTWLHGQGSGRVAVVLDFAAAGATLATAEVLGSVVEAEVALYPGSEPRRAHFTGDRSVVGSAGHLPATGMAAALDQVATWLAGNPFADRFPVALAGVVPVADGSRRLVVEPGSGAALPLSPEGPVLPLLAVSGGHPIDLFAEWDGFTLTPLSVLADGALVAL